MVNNRIRLVSLGLVFSILACSLIESSPFVESEPSQPQETEISSGDADTESLPDVEVDTEGVQRLAQFGTFQPDEIRLPETFTGYSLPLERGNLTNLDGAELSEAQIALLEEYGFVVAEPEPGQYQEFYQLYESMRYRDIPMFITTDSVLHVYHLLFDKLLRDLETRKFIPVLEDLTMGMIEGCEAQLQEVQGTDLQFAAERNLAVFAVAARLLDMDYEAPESVQALVQAEYDLIMAHEGAEVSPIWDRDDLEPTEKLIEDYTQYIPRGHYTRSEALERYFRTMMYMGRMTYRLRDPVETQRALLLTRIMTSNTSPSGAGIADLWQSIYEPTVFLVGKADDLSYFEYADLSDRVFGAGAPISSFGDPRLLDAFMEASEELPPPQINSMWVWIWEDEDQATKGFRFMGQRFTIDAYVFEQMIWREVGTLDNPRGLPKALDFFAAQGSDEALALLEEMGENEYENFDSQMSEIRGQLAALDEDTWTENVYWSWLYALKPVFAEKGEQFPEFMRTQAWLRKDLQTALGSYTELKHDTILYAKQVMAEMGGGAPPEIPRGYVEPNPEAYARLAALAEMTRTGLEERGLLDELMATYLLNLEELLDFLKTVSEKELFQEPLTEAEYTRINYYGGELEFLTYAAADCESEDEGTGACRDLEDQKAALVADIATGLSDQGQGLYVLEEAIGEPAPIYVVPPDEPRRITVGAVFTYYEFVNPADERMTDEDWQALVEAGSQGPQPAWTEIFTAP